jgi:hypothetical protein
VPDYRLTTQRVEWLPSSNFRIPLALPLEVC